MVRKCRLHARSLPRCLAASGAVMLILIVVKGFGLARLRLVTTGVLVVLVLFLFGVGPLFRHT